MDGTASEGEAKGRDMSEILEFSAGKFKIVCFTGGYPLRADLTADGAMMRIDGTELKDLEYILERMRTAMRQHYLRPGYSLEHNAVGLE